MSKFGYEWDKFFPPTEAEEQFSDEQPETPEQQKQPWEMVGGIQFNKQPYVVRENINTLGLGGDEVFRINISAAPGTVAASGFSPNDVFAVFVKRNPDGAVRTVMICFDRFLDYPEPQIGEVSDKVLAQFIKPKTDK